MCFILSFHLKPFQNHESVSSAIPVFIAAHTVFDEQGRKKNKENERKKNRVWSFPSFGTHLAAFLTLALVTNPHRRRAPAQSAKFSHRYNTPGLGFSGSTLFCAFFARLVLMHSSRLISFLVCTPSPACIATNENFEYHFFVPRRPNCSCSLRLINTWREVRGHGMCIMVLSLVGWTPTLVEALRKKITKFERSLIILLLDAS